MPHDFDAGPAEPSGPERALTGWRLWVSSPRHLVATSAAVAVLGFLVGCLITVIFVFPPQNVASDLTRVPDMVGQMADDARSRAESAGLSYEEATGLYHHLPAGTVLAQEPLAGQMAPPASWVRVTLSLGPPQRAVPDVVGLDEDQARTVLGQAGFESELTYVDAGADVGEVVGTRPAAGTPLELPGSVRVLVSAGQRTVQVPDLVMHSLAEARVTLERLGLRLGRVDEDSASFSAPGTVIAQSPAAGREVNRASGVSVTVAITPPPLPDTAGLEEDTAAVPADTVSVPPDTTGVPPDTTGPPPDAAADNRRFDEEAGD
jgi:serine/threonine-protein kinase